MATDKLFSIVGTSRHNGEVKVRFANDIMRVKVLAKHGHEDVTLVELDEPMDKMAAAAFIQSLPEFQGPDEQFAIADYIERNTPREKVGRVEKPAKVKKVKAPKAKDEFADPADVEVDEADELAAAESIVDELEDQPF